MTVPSTVLAPKATPLPLSQVRRQLSLDFCCWCAIGGQQDLQYQNKQVMNTDTGYLSETWQCSSTHNNMTPSCLQSLSLLQWKI